MPPTARSALPCAFVFPSVPPFYTKASSWAPGRPQSNWWLVWGRRTTAGFPFFSSTFPVSFLPSAARRRRRRAPPPPPLSFAPGMELHGARAAARCIDRRLFSPRGKFYIFAPIFRSASTCMVPSLIMRVSSDRFPGFLAFFNAIHESGSLKSVCLRQVFVVGKNVYTLVLQKVMCMCI